MQTKYILTDIEGTTTDIAFVHKVLFPFSLKFLEDYVRENELKSEIQEILGKTKETLIQENKCTPTKQEIIQALKDWIIIDRKHPALKSLQGYIWESGYQSGEIKAHLYPDVIPAWEKWRKNLLQLGIYSSGSVKAQKLLFAHTEKGDLTPMLDHFFDTSVGAKQDVSSYLNILKKIDMLGPQVLFLSDVEKELDAAQMAGFQTLQLIRPGTVKSGQHLSVSSFDQIKLI